MSRYHHRHHHHHHHHHHYYYYYYHYYYYYYCYYYYYYFIIIIIKLFVVAIYIFFNNKHYNIMIPILNILFSYICLLTGLTGKQSIFLLCWGTLNMHLLIPILKQKCLLLLLTDVCDFFFLFSI